jgi:hypothetical protein
MNPKTGESVVMVKARINYIPFSQARHVQASSYESGILCITTNIFFKDKELIYA